MIIKEMHDEMHAMDHVKAYLRIIYCLRYQTICNRYLLILWIKFLSLCLFQSNAEV